MPYPVIACLIVMCVLVASAGGTGTAPAEKEILATLVRSHPRVILTPQRLQQLQNAVKTDPACRKILAALEARGRKILPSDPVKYEIIGPRLLAQSRKCLDDVTTCALLYRLTGDKAYRDRAILDMTTAAAFKDWNPAHFLDTAEMTCALGLGYDWLFDALTDTQRRQIREALVTHGLRAGETAYKGQAPYGWWTQATHNWSQVCNGGLAVGALAIADEEPELASFTLAAGLKAVRGAFAHWDADGGWDEGPGYWGYTTLYTSYYLAALQSALGTMYGLDKTPGLDNAGLFRLHFVGPTGRVFNFADAGDGADTSPPMFFFSRLYDRPEYAWSHRQERLDRAFDLIWYDARGQGPGATGLPGNKIFRGIDVVFLRSAWEDPKALWVGVKGGNNAANHSHLDLGTFVLEAAGQRWLVDLGPDDYNLPGYFGAQRWTYARLMTETHNTVLIDGQNQPLKAQAHVLAFVDGKEGASTVIDLSDAYPMTQRVQRGVRFLANARGVPAAVLVQDEIQAAAPIGVVSAFHTPAVVTVAADGRSAALQLGGQELHVALRGDGQARLTAEPVKIEPPQKELQGMTRLRVTFPGKIRQAAMALAFSVQPFDVPKLTPLSQWPGMEKVRPLDR